MNVINIRDFIEHIRLDTLEKFNEKHKDERASRLAIVQVKCDPASDLYVKSKLTELPKWNIAVDYFGLNPQISSTELREFLNSISYKKTESNMDYFYDGIILQLPLPDHLRDQTQRFIDCIQQEQNVDGFEQRYTNTLFTPCTPKGILEIIEKIAEPSIKGRNIVLLGRGATVGKPLAKELLSRNYNLTVLNSKTTQEEMEFYLKNADIVVSAVGKPNLFNANMLSSTKPVYVIDAGISRVEGKQIGDFSHEEPEEQKEIYYTPYVGGVGKMTVAMLAANVYEATTYR